MWAHVRSNKNPSALCNLCFPREEKSHPRCPFAPGARPQPAVSLPIRPFSAQACACPERFALPWQRELSILLIICAAFGLTWQLEIRIETHEWEKQQRNPPRDGWSTAG